MRPSLHKCEVSVCRMQRISRASYVTCNLVSLCGHTFDHSRPRRVCIIYSALAYVVSSNKERRFRIVGSEQVQKFVGVYVGAVIVCYSNSVRHRTVIDAFSAVWLIPELRAGNATGATSRWEEIGVTAAAIFEETVRSIAIVGCDASTRSVSFSDAVIM